MGNHKKEKSEWSLSTYVTVVLRWLENITMVDLEKERYKMDVQLLVIPGVVLALLVAYFIYKIIKNNRDRVKAKEEKRRMKQEKKKKWNQNSNTVFDYQKQSYLFVASETGLFNILTNKEIYFMTFCEVLSGCQTTTGPLSSVLLMAIQFISQEF